MSEMKGRPSAKKMDGTDNVFVLGVTKDNEFVPGATKEQIDAILAESLEAQRETIDRFISDLDQIPPDQDEIVTYGSLMRYLQSECVFHLSALGAATLIELHRMAKRASLLEDKGGS